MADTFLSTHVIRPAVANPAALSLATSVFDNILCAVTSLGKVFMLEKTNNETPDNVTIIAAFGGGNWIQVKGRVFSSVPDEATMIALHATEGDIAFRTDTNSSFIKNNLITSTIADWLPLSAATTPNVNFVSTSYVGALSDNEGLVVFNNLTANENFTLPENATAAIPVGGFIDVYNFSFYKVTPILQGSDTAVFLNPITLLGSVRFKKISITGSASEWEMIFRSNIIPIITAVTPPYALSVNDVETIIDVISPGIITVGGPPPAGSFVGVGGTVKNSSTGIVKIKGSMGATFEGKSEYDLMPGQAIFFGFDGISDFKIVNQFVGTQNLLEPVDLSGSTTVTLAAAYHGKAIKVGNNGTGGIVLPQNSTVFLPVGFTTEAINQGVANFNFVVQGSDIILNGQTLLRNNKCRIRKVGVDITGLISTWLIDDLDQSETVPDNIFSSIGSFPLTAAYNKSTIIQTSPQTITLPVPVVIYSGIWDGFSFTVKNICGANTTLSALVGTLIEGSSSLIIPNNTAFKINVWNGNYYVVGSYQIVSSTSSDFISAPLIRTSGTYNVTESDKGKIIVGDNTASLFVNLPNFPALSSQFYCTFVSASLYPTIVNSSPSQLLGGQQFISIPLSGSLMVGLDSVQYQVLNNPIHHSPQILITLNSTTATVGSINDGGVIINKSLGSEIAFPPIGTGEIQSGWKCTIINDSNNILALHANLPNLLEGYTDLELSPNTRVTVEAQSNLASGAHYIFTDKTNFFTNNLVEKVTILTGATTLDVSHVGQYITGSGGTPFDVGLPQASSVPPNSLIWIDSGTSTALQILPFGSDKIDGYTTPKPIPLNTGTPFIRTDSTNWKSAINPFPNRNTFAVSSITLLQRHWGAVIYGEVAGGIITLGAFGSILPQNWCVTVKNISSGNITVQTTGSDTIDGSSSILIASNGCIDIFGGVDPLAGTNNFSLLSKIGVDTGSPKTLIWNTDTNDSATTGDAFGGLIRVRKLVGNTSFGFILPDDVNTFISFQAILYFGTIVGTAPFNVGIRGLYGAYPGGIDANVTGSTIGITPTGNNTWSTLNIASAFGGFGPFGGNTGSIEINPAVGWPTDSGVVGFKLIYNPL